MHRFDSSLPTSAPVQQPPSVRVSRYTRQLSASRHQGHGRKLTVTPVPCLPADTWPTPFRLLPPRTLLTFPASASPPPPSSSRRSPENLCRYLSELLAERNKLGPFMPVLPHCYRLLNQEILRVTTLLGNASILDQGGTEHGRPLTTGGIFSNGAAADLNGWTSTFRTERLGMIQPTSGHSWLGPQGGSSSMIVKKTIRVDIPVDKYPNYNFVGRLIGPRGNFLKQVEASTECRVLIRGLGSIQDPNWENVMRGKPGYEHLNEPFHILLDAELPVEIIDSRLMQARDILEELLKPVDESQDLVKQQQLCELAILNGALRDEDSQMFDSLSPFHNGLGMKRVKSGG